MFLKLISIYHMVMGKTALLMELNLKGFSYLVDFPCGVDEGNFYLKIFYIQKVVHVIMKSNFCNVFEIFKNFSLNMLEPTLENIYYFI